ncbi:hypothetical protein ACOMHN_000506 [Nucella lapillus]
MDDLAALSDVTGPSVLNALLERFKHGQYNTYCGDILVSFNPCRDMEENESELGQWYRKSKPLQELPPHVVAVAHRAHRMLVNDVMPQAVVIMGRPASGKSEAARRILSQLLREARLSPKSGLGPTIIMAQHILTSLITAGTLDNPDSTRAIKMATLYFRPDGGIVSAELQALCMGKWFLTDRRSGCGAFAIFYAMLAGMSDQEMRLYYFNNTRSSHIDRLVNKNDSRPLFAGREEHERYLQLFDFFSHCLANTGIDQPTRNYAGKELSSIFAVLAAILHLGNVDVTANPQNGRPTILNPHEMASVCDLLAISQDYLEAEILSSSVLVRGETVRMACTADQAAWRRDVILVELYHRLVSVITSRLNHAMSPESHYVDQGALTPITVVDSLGQEYSHQASTGGLEAFFRNMASERLHHYLYDVIFHRDVETCERERVTPYKIKFAHNTDLISAVFGPDYGIMTKLTAVTSDGQGSAERLVTLMDADRSLRKNGSYVHAGKAVKSADVFFIKHSGLGQITYSATDFIPKNRSSLPDSTVQMLMGSANPLVPVLASFAFHQSSFPPDANSPDTFFATRTFQSDLTYLLQSLDNANVHFIRCLKGSGTMTAGQLDSQMVTDQIKECCLVETARQRKFGFSANMPQEHFVRSYRDLAFGTYSRITSALEACKTILNKTQLHGKGVTLSKASVFLRYWHVNRLHAIKAEHVRKIVTVQACVRGFVARRRFRRKLASLGPRGGMQQGRQPQQDTQPFWNHQDGMGHPGYANGSFRDYPGYAPRDPPSRDDPGYAPKEPSSRNDTGYATRESARSDLGYARGSPRHRDLSVSSLGVDDASGLYRVIVEKVLSSLPTLDSGTWAKLIYLERGKQVAKAYAEERSIIVDGSHAAFDGSRLGLGLCRNQDRDEETAFLLSNLHEGVRLKHESDDSISACRLCDQPVVMKGLDDTVPAGFCFSEDVLLHRGQLPLEKTIKIFDMKEFRSKIALDLKQGRFSKGTMRRACVVGLAFGRDDADDTQTPCWLCIVNVRALVSLESEDLIRKAQIYTAELQMTSPETEEEKAKSEEAKRRHGRKKWSRVDQREHLQEKEEGGRHVRHKLRAKGMSVGEHVGYSWDHTQGAEKTTMQDLQDWADPQLSGIARKSRGSGQTRDWAKVETAVRDETNKIGMGHSMSNPGY